jgi:hypothetical protein
MVCSFTQAHTAFLSFSLSLASGCITEYIRGGILAVEISPQMDSNLSRFCRVEYVSHAEKSNFSLPSLTWRAIHQETGPTWLYQGQSVWLEWQLPQARIKICAGSEYGESCSSVFFGSVTELCSVPASPAIRATDNNAKINFVTLTIEFYRSQSRLTAIVRPEGDTTLFCFPLEK